MSRIAEEKVREYLEVQGLGGFFISRPENVRYVSGYTGEDSSLLITAKEKYFFTDPRYTEQASSECPDYTIIDYRGTYGCIFAALASLTEKEGVKHCGFEADYVVALDFQRMQEMVKAEMAPLTGVVEEFRSHKTAEEVTCLRAACEIASRAYDWIVKDIRVGITEKELAANLSRYMVLEGADTQPYGNILISGTRTSLLHGIPSEKAVEYGDLVLMDYGCQYHGYMSDMTRTVVVGRATPKQQEVYGLVRQMLEDMSQSVRAGVDCRDAYEASAQAVKDTEYYPYHYTGVGHGIGLYVHEAPFYGPKSEDVLAKGMVTTLEPGIYIPGWGGIRIEDQVLITETGMENLISVGHELVEL